MLTLLKINLNSIKNYFVHKLDLITRLEIFAALGVAVFYVFFLLHGKFEYFSPDKENQAVKLLELVLNLLILSNLLSMIPLTMKTINNQNNQNTLTLPIAPNMITANFMILTSISGLLHFLFGIGVFVLYVTFFSLNISTPLFFLLQIIASSACGFLIGFFKTSIQKLIDGITIIAGSFFILLAVIYTFPFWLDVLFIFLALVIVISSSLASVRKIIKKSPERFYHQSSQSIKSNKILEIILSFVPQSVKHIVRKDLLFTNRQYKSFWWMWGFMFLVTVFGIFKMETASFAEQWFVSLNIAFAWLFTNTSFKFHQDAENMKLLKTQTLHGHTFWWGKFWTTFLPNLWFILLTTCTLLIKIKFDLFPFLRSPLLVFALAFSLTFFQNNFALYSFPYSRYAPIWYNFYLLINIAFFTVLLFPPLPIVLIVLGFTSYFKVKNKIEQIEAFE